MTDVGVFIFPTADTPGPASLAQMAEARGFESIWFPEHTHIPASRESRHPAHAELPAHYPHTLDLFVSLAAAAATTARIKVGTGVCLVVQRDPIVLAKELATLDLISGGRLLFGVGAGWNREEMRNHGTDPRTRMRLLAERIAAIKQIWADDEATYHGEFVNFDRIWCWPKPVQVPHPPILIGGHGPGVFERVLAYGDGWLPMMMGTDDELIDEVQRLRERAGRHVPVTLFGSSSPSRLARYAEAGIDRVVLTLHQGNAAAVEARLDQFAERAEQAGLLTVKSD